MIELTDIEGIPCSFSYIYVIIDDAVGSLSNIVLTIIRNNPNYFYPPFNELVVVGCWKYVFFGSNARPRFRDLIGTRFGSSTSELPRYYFVEQLITATIVSEAYFENQWRNFFLLHTHFT